MLSGNISDTPKMLSGNIKLCFLYKVNHQCIPFSWKLQKFFSNLFQIYHFTNSIISHCHHMHFFHYGQHEVTLKRAYFILFCFCLILMFSLMSDVFWDWVYFGNSKLLKTKLVYMFCVSDQSKNISSVIVEVSSSAWLLTLGKRHPWDFTLGGPRGANHGWAGKVWKYGVSMSLDRWKWHFQSLLYLI